ncbi:MAG: Rho termination factor N-terminal domain-containing protein, partial [Thermodesulfobacteriota bacterium]
MTKDELTKKTIKELVVLARRKGLRGVSRLRKSQLIAKLLEATSGPPSSRPPRRAHLSPRVSRKAAAGLTQQTRTQLLAVAKQRGLTGVSRLRKAELLARLAGDPFSVPPPVPPVPSTPSAPEPLPPAELPPVAAPQP